MNIKYKYRDINLKKLIVNPENYRFEPVKDETDAIKTMLDQNNKNIIELLKDIVINGLNPSERLIVYETNNSFIVLEGNRRVTALKIIENVTILDDIDKNYYNQYSKVISKSLKNTNHNLTAIPCVVFENVEDANKWIELKHTGLNGGKGTVPWNTNEKRRFKDKTLSNNKSNVITSLFDYIKTSKLYPDIIKQNLNIIPITTLERLLQDPLVREAIGIQITKNIIFKLYPDEEIQKPLIKILNDLINKKIVVKNIYTKNQRIEYTSNFKINELPDSNKQLETPLKLIEKSPVYNNNNKLLPLQIGLDSFNVNKDNNDNMKKTLKYTNDNNNSLERSDNLKFIRDTKEINNRKYLIPAKLQLKISSPRINQIYKELKKLEIEKYPNSVAVLFRIFIELNIDNYILNNNMDHVTIDTNLNKKVQASLDDLTNKNLINNHLAKIINLTISDNNNLLSINTFNSYVHNKDAFPNILHLKTIWNNIQEFLILLIENC